MPTLYENPWASGEGWSLTKQMRFVRQHGMALATAYARDAGTTVGGLKPKALPKQRPDVYVISKKITVEGDTQAGRGSSGFGPPTG